MPSLFDLIRVGDIELSSRIVMAPLTRNRAAAGQVPTPLMAEYYAQRADPGTGAGLIVTGATQISQEGQGYLDTPGLFTAEQVAGWKQVTRAVHERGGKIVTQLWHVGRVSHTSLQAGGAAPVAPSAIRANTKTYVKEGFVPVSEPRELKLEEIPRIVGQYRDAANRAIEAGFDGVEIHGANGYLLDQFLRDGINQRSDIYGGSIENRARLLLEVVEAITGAIGAGRTGLRLSPVTPANDARDSDPQPLFDYVADQLGRYKLAYLHAVEGATGGPRDVPAREGVPFDYQSLRRRAAAPWVANNGYDLGLAQATLDSGAADLIAFGRPFISNPDLGARLRTGAPLNKWNSATFYGGASEGYTDYPTLQAGAN